MIWRRGFLRLWVVGSIVWIAYIVISSINYYESSKALAKDYGYPDAYAFTLADFGYAALTASVPCLVVLYASGQDRGGSD